jgi:hypothetical protein
LIAISRISTLFITGHRVELDGELELEESESLGELEELLLSPELLLDFALWRHFVCAASSQFSIVYQLLIHLYLFERPSMSRYGKRNRVDHEIRIHCQILSTSGIWASSHHTFTDQLSFCWKINNFTFTRLSLHRSHALLSGMAST